jgi:hypothetical protein
MHLVVAVAFSVDPGGNNVITSTFTVNGGNAQTRSRTLPVGFGTYNASDWDPEARLNVFPNMDVTMPRSSKPGNIFYVAVHNEVS